MKEVMAVGKGVPTGDLGETVKTVEVKRRQHKLCTKMPQGKTPTCMVIKNKQKHKNKKRMACGTVVTVKSRADSKCTHWLRLRLKTWLHIKAHYE